ncbi:MAG TPA: TlpA disulfide reductase family protein [Gemmatimonadaceae bacterium]|nr:TlpA disulfide reductase family protein [Gemmatimonadaceae bacterium]
MMTRSSFVTLVAAATFAAALPALAPALHAQDIGIDVGTKAPAAPLETLDGKPANLSQFIGKSPVLIEFWATWCPNCRELEPTLLKMVKKYSPRMQFVGVAVSVNESPELVKRYAAKHDFTHHILYDKTGDALTAYNVPATSYIVVLNKAGTVVYTGLGGDQNLEAAIEKGLGKEVGQ